MVKALRRVACPLSIVLVLGVLGARAHAQTSAVPSVPPVPAAAAYSVTATRVRVPPVIDGGLDDAVWSTAQVLSDFRQQVPEPGRPATQRTEVRVLVDATALYVGMRLYDTAPDSIVGTLARRDYAGYSDWAHVIIDSFHDHRTAFHFAVNPSGVKRDGFIAADAEFSEDFGWDAVWEVATRRDSAGWTAEFRIPLSQLRFASSGNASSGNGDTGAVWGIEFAREIARRGERSLWVPIAPNSGRFVSLFGTLAGVPVREAKRRLEISPYILARARQSDDAAAASGAGAASNPLRPSSQQAAAVGADFKIGLTSDITLTGTVNPDFGHVEADPSQVNLTGAETFFAERRPFFMEGSDLFRYNLSWGDWLFGSEELFYSRRIGRMPQVDFPDSANYTSAAEPTHLIAAGKLSGHSHAWLLGLLSATTARETGRYTYLTSSAAGAGSGKVAGRADQVTEPLTHYGVLRLGRTFRDGSSEIGVIGTATNRQLEQASADVLHSSAFAGGLEGRTRFGEGNYALVGYVFGSRVAGSPLAIARTQTSFRHLFQRDPSLLGLDSAATSLSGLSSEVRLVKMGGGRLRVGLTAHAVTRGYDVNDLGFITNSNFVNTTGWVGRERVAPTKHTRSWSTYVNWWAQRSLIGPAEIVGANWWNNVQFQNYWMLNGWVERTLDGTSTSLLRGGPAIRTSGRTFGSYRIATDPRPRLSWIFDVAGSPTSADGSWLASVGPGLTVRPTARAELQLQPMLTRQRTGTQYIASPPTSAGRLYLVGDLRQSTVSLTERGSFAFTPALTLQAYVQPFMSNGRFERAGEVVSPLAWRASERVHFYPVSDVSTSADRQQVTYRTSAGPVTVDNPDFSITNLNANVVLRWEYRAGSTVYVVWNQGRSGSAHEGDATVGALSRDLWATPATNVLLVKWAHYFSR